MDLSDNKNISIDNAPDNLSDENKMNDSKSLHISDKKLFEKIELNIQVENSPEQFEEEFQDPIIIHESNKVDLSLKLAEQNKNIPEDGKSTPVISPIILDRNILYRPYKVTGRRDSNHLSASFPLDYFGESQGVDCENNVDQKIKFARTAFSSPAITRSHQTPLITPKSPNRGINLKKQDAMLSKIEDKALGYRWIHDQEFKYNMKQDKKLQNILNILNGLQGVSSSGAVLSIFSTNYKGIGITIIIIFQLLLSFLIGILLQKKENSDYKIKAFEHKQVSSEYEHLYNSIQKEFTLENRTPSFLDDILKEYEKLREASSNGIRQDTITKYENMIKNRNLTNVDELSNIPTSVRENIKDDSRKKYEIDRWQKNF